jgi:hypothetical protein
VGRRIVDDENAGCHRRRFGLSFSITENVYPQAIDCPAGVRRDHSGRTGGVKAPLSIHTLVIAPSQAGRSAGAQAT